MSPEPMTFSMMIGSIIDGVASAANVARRHLHRGSNTRTDAIGDAVMIASGV
jgi:hypothetical protein